MANYAEGINPEILRWARERAGYSISQIAEEFNKDPEDISAWEEGDTVPTYNQLELLAYRYYKRPIALFFFPSPPPEVDPGEEFRTLPDFVIENLLPDTRHAIRHGLAMQQSLRELTDGQNRSERQVFKDLQFNPEDSIPELATQLRNYLGVSLGQQSDWSGVSVALANWREEVQKVGVFIFKRSFKQEDVSGYCLIDSEFPIIYLNNSTSKSRQIFTIFHELAHILLKSSGITKIRNDYIDSLSGYDRSVEIFCNAFTSEFLVPLSDFQGRFDQNQEIEFMVDECAEFYNVSREVILRKLLDLGLVTQGYYQQMAQLWIEEFNEFRRTGRGGNYYATQAAYLGDFYMNLAFSRYYEGRLSIQDLAEHLNIKAKSVEGLERQMLRRAAAR